MDIVYSPIGVIHSGFTCKDNTPIQSIFSDACGTVEVFPEYAPGLKDIEGFSYIYLIYHFDRAEARCVVQRPFLDPHNERGIFAIRHPNRPNPIGISIVKLNAVRGNVLEVCGLDILDGTPVLDIKPYVRQFDHREPEQSGWVDNRSTENEDPKRFTPEALRRQKE